MRLKMVVCVLFLAVVSAYAIGPRVVVNKKVEFTVGDSAVAIVPGQCSEDLDCYDMFEVVRIVVERHWNCKMISAKQVRDVMRELNVNDSNRGNRSEIAQQVGVGMLLITHIRLEDTKRGSEDDFSDVVAPLEVELVLVNAVTDQELLRGVAYTRSDLDGAADAVEEAIEEILIEAEYNKR